MLEPEKPGEVEIPTVQHIVGARQENQDIEGRDVGKFAVGDVHDLGNVPAQVEQCVELDGPLVLAEPGPREERQAEVDRRRVECVDGGRRSTPRGRRHRAAWRS